MIKKQKNILWFKEISKKDVALVGGKNASLGEMFCQLTKKDIHPVRGQRGPAEKQTKQTSNGVNIPDGFILTARAYWYFLKANKIDKEIKKLFDDFDSRNIDLLKETGRKARQMILKSEFPHDLEKEIIKNYQKLSQKYREKEVSVAVRSSATAEDLPSASFAGQHESYLNISGEEELLKAVKKCLASLFTDRAIAYREEKGFSQFKIALSVGIQKMVRSDLASAGVMFTLDTETGFENVVLINSIYGVGEMIVKGRITPDEFYVFKPTRAVISKKLGRKTKKFIYNLKGGLKEVKVSQKDQNRFSLTEKEILILSDWACLIEKHYQAHQDIEWAKDGKTKELFIVQSRPETVHAREKVRFYEEYQIEKARKPILTGIAVGKKIGQGRVRVIKDVSKISQFKKGEVLVTKMTDPDWVPIIRQAAAVVTDEGSKVCHAAIVSRELGIPCIVGALKATAVLKNSQAVTIDCTEGLEGKIYQGIIPFRVKKYNLKKIPKLKTKIMLNIGTPESAFRNSFLPNDGVGLTRQEFIVSEKIKVHPLLLNRTKEKRQYFIDKLAEGIAQIGAAFYPKEVILRFSDFKTNEYRNLVGGKSFENEEANPMLGFRGACRYLDKTFQPAFRMECQAIKKVRQEFGLKNITLMVPFCRTVDEGKNVLALMKKFGLEKGKDGLKVIVMCEIPSNVILAEEFLKIFDGMSIGSNDLTQLVLGLDRDNAKIVYIGDERNEAVKKMISRVIKLCNQKNKYCGICGQAPSDFPEFAQFLIMEGIESISLNPDTVVKTILLLTKNKL